MHFSVQVLSKISSSFSINYNFLRNHIFLEWYKATCSLISVYHSKQIMCWAEKFLKKVNTEQIKDQLTKAVRSAWNTHCVPGCSEIGLKNFVVFGAESKIISFQLKGESKKTMKKNAEITWTKDNEPWNPKDQGDREKFNGFTLRSIISIFLLYYMSRDG